MSRKLDKDAQITAEQVIYNLSIYLQTKGQIIPPAFKSSLQYCLQFLAKGKPLKENPPLLSDVEINKAFDEAFDKPISFDHKPTPEEIITIRLRAVAEAQRNICVNHYEGGK